MSTSYLRGFSSHRDARAAFEALIEEAAAFFTNDASPAGCMISLAGTQLPPHLRSVADYTKSLRKLFEQALAKRLRKGVSDGNLPPGTNVKELAAYFGTIFRGMAVQARDGASRKQLLAILPSRNASLALGLQDLRTRITKRITRVAPGASSPDVRLTSCRVFLSLSGQHAADTRTRQRVFWRATSLTPLESPSRDDLANLFHFGFHRLAIAVAFYESFQFASVFLSQRLRLKQRR